MFLVGGGILAHGIPWLEHWIKSIAAFRTGVAGMESVLAAMTPVFANLVVGLVAGAVALVLVTLAQKILRRTAA
jgi:predicted DNA repair protein MutK